MRIKTLSSIFIASILCISCGNPELDNRKKLLEMAIADKNHYEILKTGNDVLEIDPEDVEAISALRDSARIYLHIKNSAEKIKELSERNFDVTALDWTVDTPNDDPEFIKFLIEFYEDQNISNDPATDSEKLQMLNEWFAGFAEDEAPDTVTDLLKGRIILLEIAKIYEIFLDEFKDQADLLVEAKKSLDKAERLDPRFRGVIELEEVIEERAKIFAGYAHYYFLYAFSDIVSDAAGYYDEVKAATDSKWSEFVSIGMTDYGYGISDAYQSAKFNVDKGDWGKHLAFKIYQNNAQILLSFYKDLEDEFDDIDSLDPAISSVGYMIDVFKNTEASGTLSEWQTAMRSSIDGYVSSVKELGNEIDELEDLSEQKSELDESLDLILDVELINIVENSIFI